MLSSLLLIWNSLTSSEEITPDMSPLEYRTCWLSVTSFILLCRIIIVDGSGMNGKIIAIVVISVILGAGLGLGLSYAVFQPVINNLQLSNTQLSGRVSTMENSSFHLVYPRVIDTGASNNTFYSSTFRIKGDTVMVRWRMDANMTADWMQIMLCFENGTVFAVRGSSGTYGDYSNDVDIKPGTYFVHIRTSSSVSGYRVYIFDYY